MDSDTEFTALSEKEIEFISSNFHLQTKFTAAQNFYTNDHNILLRMLAVSIIAEHSKSIDPDTFIPYLAMNYFDRFVSKDEMILKDVEGFIDTEKVRLIAITCLEISAKMRMKYFSVHQFLRDMDERIIPRIVFKMELLILDKLDWEMQPFTAFTFLNYYYHYFKTFGGGFKRRCIYEILVQAQGEHTFVHYMPTLIAFSAFLAAFKIAYPSKYKEITHPFILSEIGPKEQVEECVKQMVDLCKRMNIQIETPESETHSTSKLRESQHNKGKAVVVDSSKEEEDEKTTFIKRMFPVQVDELSVSDDEVTVAYGNELSDYDKRVAVAKAIEAIKRRYVRCKGKIVNVTEVRADVDDKPTVEAIIRQAWKKGKAVEGESILEIVELLVVPKKLMMFELKWFTQLQLQH